MLLKILLIGILMVGLQDLKAQQVLLSEPEEINLRNDDFMVVGNCRQQIVVYRNHAAVAELIFYNTRMLKNRAVAIPFLPAKISDIHFATHGEHLLVFYVYREQRKRIVKYAQLNSEYGWLEPQLIEEQELNTPRSNESFQFRNSEKGTYTLMFQTQKQGTDSRIRAWVWSADGQLMTKLSNEFTNEIQWSNIAAVSDQGQIFVIGGKEADREEDWGELRILYASKSAPAWQQKILNIQKHTLRDLHIKLDPLHQMVYVCSFYMQDRFQNPVGLFISSFHMENLLEAGVYFTPMALQESGSRADIRDFKIRHILIRKAGGVQIITEKAYQATRQVGGMTPMIGTTFMSPMNESMRTVQEYSYDDILLFDFRVDGSLNWTKTILKSQTTLDDNGIYSSFGLLQHAQGQAFIFREVDARQNRLLVSYVSANGELTMKEIQTPQEADNWNLMPRSLVQLSRQEVVMPCVSKGYLCFLNIRY